MLLLGKIGLGFAGSALLVGAIVSSEGFVHVKVNESAPDGSHVSLVVPAMLAPVALACVPNHYLQPAAEQLKPYVSLVDAALEGLANTPDVALVSVADSHQHVFVVKSGDSIVVDVNDPDEVVHVSVPLRAAKHAMDELARAAN